MPKGKTNAPLTIWVAVEWRDQPAVAWLQAAGHAVVLLHDTSEGKPAPDWIMHPAAGWSVVFFAKNEKGEYPFVAARLKAERARKKAGK